MAANLGMYIVTMLCHAVCCLVHKTADPEMEIMDWVCPWVELGRILLNFSWVGLGWIAKYVSAFYDFF